MDPGPRPRNKDALEMLGEQPFCLKWWVTDEIDDEDTKP